jgi:hypothetical protein
MFASFGRHVAYVHPSLMQTPARIVWRVIPSWKHCCRYVRIRSKIAIPSCNVLKSFNREASVHHVLRRG